MNKVEKIKEQKEKLDKKINNFENAIKASRNILEKSKNENLVLRAKACLQDLLDEDSGNKDIGYDVMNAHSHSFGKDGKSWTSELTPEEREWYYDLVKGFDEVDFVFGNTKYDEYSSGHFFRRS